MPEPIVEISQNGRGGSIEYFEGTNRIHFDWEFAMSPTLALILGPVGAHFDKNFPWAAGRQEEIFDFVGSDVVRQQAPDHEYTIDLERGWIDIVRAKSKPGARSPSRSGRGRSARVSPPAPAAPSPTTDQTSVRTTRRSAAFTRFMASVVPVWETWAEGETYDVKALRKMTPEEWQEVVEMMTGRDVTWREVEVLSAIDLPAARAAVEAASKHHLSADTRLAGAEAMHRQDRLPAFEEQLALQIRRMNRPADGLARALRLAEEHPSETIRQALLWASYNQTECAPSFASLLLRLTGAASEPFDEKVQAMLRSLDLHNSSRTRDAAFGELKAMVRMELDHDVAY